MKKMKFIHGLTKSCPYGFLATRLVWQNPETAPNNEVQHEFKDIENLVKSLEGMSKEYSVTKSKTVLALVSKMEDKAIFFSPELLGALAGRKEVSIRKAVALSPNATPETLAKLAQDKDEEVRLAARWNPSVPENFRFKTGREERQKYVRPGNKIK